MKKKYTFVLSNGKYSVTVNGDTLLYLVNCQALKKLTIDYTVPRDLGNINRPAILTLDCSDTFLKLMSNE